MENYILQYRVTATDEFGRQFQSYARISALNLIVKEQADPLYIQAMMALVTDILWRMGTEVKAEWSTVVVEEEEFIVL